MPSIRRGVVHAACWSSCSPTVVVFGGGKPSLNACHGVRPDMPPTVASRVPLGASSGAGEEGRRSCGERWTTTDCRGCGCSGFGSSGSQLTCFPKASVSPRPSRPSGIARPESCLPGETVPGPPHLPTTSRASHCRPRWNWRETHAGDPSGLDRRARRRCVERRPGSLPEPRDLHSEPVGARPTGMKRLVTAERLQCFALSARGLDHGPGRWVRPDMKHVFDTVRPAG